MADGELAGAIRAVYAEFLACFARGDMNGVAACYSEDALIMPPQAEPLAGRAAIAALFASLRAAGVASATLETLEAEAAGDTAWETGRYAMRAADGALIDRGKYLVVWKRRGGAWRMHRDIFNSSLPPA